MLSENLKKTRKIRGYTAQYMAESLGVGIRNYRKYESGHTSPTLDGLVKIADLLDVTTDYLLSRHNNSSAGCVEKH